MLAEGGCVVGGGLLGNKSSLSFREGGVKSIIIPLVAVSDESLIPFVPRTIA